MGEKLRTLIGKKLGQQGTTLLLQQPPVYLKPMIQFPLSRQVQHAPGSACFFIVGAKDQPTNARLDHCSDTHSTWLQGDVQSRIRESVVTLRGTRRS